MLRIPVAWMKRSVIRDFSATFNIPGLQNTSMYSALRASQRLFKFNPIEFSPLRCIRATGVVLTRIHARQDSIDRPWSIDPTSEAVFGELDGEQYLPTKFAEAFAFDRAIEITDGRQDA